MGIIMGIPWEYHGNNIGHNHWNNHGDYGNIIGIAWEYHGDNHGNIMGIIMGIMGIMGISVLNGDFP